MPDKTPSGESQSRRVISTGYAAISIFIGVLSGFRHPRGKESPQGIDRASHTPFAAIQIMGVDHGGLDVCMTEQLLNRPDIISVLQEVGREGMMRACGSWQLRTEMYAGGANASEWAGAASCSPELGLKSYPWSIPSGQLRRSGREGQRTGGYS